MLLAPMPGVVKAVNCKVGDEVSMTVSGAWLLSHLSVSYLSARL